MIHAEYAFETASKYVGMNRIPYTIAQIRITDPEYSTRKGYLLLVQGESWVYKKDVLHVVQKTGKTELLIANGKSHKLLGLFKTNRIDFEQIFENLDAKSADVQSL